MYPKSIKIYIKHFFKKNIQKSYFDILFSHNYSVLYALFSYVDYIRALDDDAKLNFFYN